MEDINPDCRKQALVSKNSEFDVITADSSDAAQQVFANRKIDIVLAQWRSLLRMDGARFLEWVRINHPQTIRLLITGFAPLDQAVDACNRCDLFRYLLLPLGPEAEHEVLDALRMAARAFVLEREREQLSQEILTLRSQPGSQSSCCFTVDRLKSIIAESPIAEVDGEHEPVRPQ
jgi:DNA-binding NtrC family response regulator